MSVKRQSSTIDGAVSPPPTKRKIESTTTSKAVASFFQPASKKEPERIIWRTVNQSLIIGKSNDSDNNIQPLQHPVRVAAFDLDDTVIAPLNQGNRWARSETSWKWWDSSVPGRLKELYNKGFLVILLSNQGTLSLKDDPKKLQKDKLSVANFKSQIASIFRQLDFPISVYAATTQDHYRKPRTGMWEEMKDDYDLDFRDAIDLSGSFYVGDAAGRDKTDKRRKDHACSDRNLASNIGIEFHTPEEFFLSATPELYVQPFQPIEYLSRLNAKTTPLIPFERKNPQDIVMFCGSPGAGKSSFFWTALQPLGYERVNQDILKSRDRCIKKAREFLTSGISVAVDNTNRDVETRAHWIKLAQEYKIPIRCVYFTASTRLCEHNAVFRALNKQMNPENRDNLPPIAFVDFARRFMEPRLEEGFQDITKVDFDFTGTDEQRQLWSKHWASKFST